MSPIKSFHIKDRKHLKISIADFHEKEKYDIIFIKISVS